MKLVLTIAAAIVALSVLWGAGELHRRNCVNEGRSGCSVLPWASGHEVSEAKPAKPRAGSAACVTAQAAAEWGAANGRPAPGNVCAP